MEFPKISKNPMRTVKIPKLEGGTNLRDAVNLIEDNQLTDSLNIWYKNGILQTRPGLYTHQSLSWGYGLYDENVKCKPLDIYMNKNNDLYRLIQFEAYGTTKTPNGYGEMGVAHYGFVWMCYYNIILLPEINEEISFTTQFKNKIYVFTTGRNIYTMEINPNEDTPTWIRLSYENENDIYIPTVFTGCRPVGDTTELETEYRENYGGVLVEGYSLITPYYKMIYSTVNREKLDASDAGARHLMTYNLAHSVSNADFAGLKVKAVIKNGSTGVERVHEVTLTGGNEIISETESVDGLYMHVGDYGITFYYSDGSVADVGILDYFENNMEIIAPCPNLPENLEKVFGMRESCWFGGDSLGISGGNRLFLGGNQSSEKEKSLVIWSGLNDPTYFSENCYAYVGNNGQSVTAFGRQGDSLVIFKERETFYTQYTRNTDISAESLINQSVIDYRASNVYFPMIQLHSGIGCDCPNTIQLCRNYLVWAHSDGNVYTLRNENQYSERNIYCVSDMIKRSLKENSAEDLKLSHSADYYGHYFLFVGSKVYVMNYESYGYVYASSHTKNEDAQIKIPWWKWLLPYSEGWSSEVAVFNRARPLNLVCGFTLGNELACVMYNADGYISNFYACRFLDDYGCDFDSNDNKSEIKSMLTTKLFDFGAPHHTKNVPLVNISFGNNGGNPIKVSFVTDTGTEENEVVTISESDSDEYSPDFVHNRQFRPCVRLINRIGIKVECEGKMSVDSISLDYKILGGSR